jgi:pimeloyl-ACP methyl ester carboxylesterase
VTTAELLVQLQQLGVELRLEGEGLRYRAPAGALTATLRAELARCKGEILEVLRERTQVKRPGHEAFFFGPDDQKIFAQYHPPVRGDGQTLIVICPPLFSDFMRTHLALRELAMALAERGQHVLRFDYRGTGDSFQDLAEVSVHDWVEDIALAVREGLARSGSADVRLLGVRAGALLACKSMGDSSQVRRLVLWDPVPDGAHYLQELRRVQDALIGQHLRLSRAERREARQEYSGYHLSEPLLEGIRSLGGNIYSSIPKGKLHVLSTSASAAFTVPGVPGDVAPFDCNWETDSEDRLLMTRPLLERFIACLTTS